MEYEKTVGALLGGLTPDNHPVAVEIASIPEHIRGFGHIRERHLKAARARQDELWEAYRSPAPPQADAAE